MTEYYLPPDPLAGMSPFNGIVRDDGAWIPSDPANRDWAEYQDWLAAGGTPNPPKPPVHPALDAYDMGETAQTILGA
jgi:hypothetical protein